MLVGMHSLWRMSSLFHIPTFNGNCRSFLTLSFLQIYGRATDVIILEV